MAHVYYHAEQAMRMFGGKIQDYLEINQWFDETKERIGDFRHRALRHHSQGIFECESIFGLTITNSDGKEVPVRLLGEMHCLADLGRVPSVADWLSCIRPEPWMARATPVKLAHGTRRKPND